MQGPKGDPATLPQGALIYLLESDPVPAGFTYVGTFKINFTDKGVRSEDVRVYRKN